VDLAGGFGETSDLDILIAHVGGSADAAAKAGEQPGQAELIYDRASGRLTLEQVDPRIVKLRIQAINREGEGALRGAGAADAWHGIAPQVAATDSGRVTLQYFAAGGLPTGGDALDVVLPRNTSVPLSTMTHSLVLSSGSESFWYSSTCHLR